MIDEKSVPAGNESEVFKGALGVKNIPLKLSVANVDFLFSESTRKLNISHTGPNHGLQNNCTSSLKRKQKPKTRSIKKSLLYK